MTEDRTDWITQLFDRLATDYDEMLPFFSGRAELHVGWLDPTPGTAVLDLGAGSGALTGALLRRGCEVSAIDSAPAMITKLARLHPAADARVMSAYQLDFPDDTFDLVCAGFVIHILDDPEVAIAEVRRVLRPSGVVSIATPRGVENAPEWDFYPALFGEFYAYLPEGEGRLGRPLDMDGLLSGAGFSDLDHTDVEQRLTVPDVDTFWSWLLSHGTRAFIDALPAPRRVEFEARMRAGVAELDPIEQVAAVTFNRGSA